MANMKPENKARLSVQERTYRALQEVASFETKHDFIDEDIVAHAVLNWTTDEIVLDDEGNYLPDESRSSEDIAMLFSLTIAHLQHHAMLEEGLKMAKELTDKIKEIGVDGKKLSEKDPEEWEKLARLVGGGPYQEEFEIPDTLDELLALAGEEAPTGDSATEVYNRAVIDKINRQSQAQQILSYYFEQVLAGNQDEVHNMIDHYGCALTHLITGTLLTHLQSRQTLPESISLSDWARDIKHSSEKLASLSDEEKIELAQRFDEDDDDL